MVCRDRGTSNLCFGALARVVINSDPTLPPCRPVGLTGLVGLAKGVLAAASPAVGAVILLAEG